MPIQFKFPIRSLQLVEQPVDPNVFYVHSRENVGQWREKDLQDQLESIMDILGGERNRCLRILTNEVFDLIYSIIFALEDVNLKIRRELLELLVNGLKNLVKIIEDTRILEWAELNFLSNSTIA